MPLAQSCIAARGLEQAGNTYRRQKSARCGRQMSRRRMVSSMSSFRPAANYFSVPTALEPLFEGRGSEAALSLAARACNGRAVTSSGSSARAWVAMPFPRRHGRSSM